MTRQKTISSLSIAAIALLAVAVPSFAQAQSDDAQGAIATQASEQTMVFSTELVAATKTRSATPAVAGIAWTRVNSLIPSASQPKLTASTFKAKNKFTLETSSHFVSPQLSFVNLDPVDPTTKKQFRADDYTSDGRKAVSFVPSRGQKLPVY